MSNSNKHILNLLKQAQEKPEKDIQSDPKKEEDSFVFIMPELRSSKEEHQNFINRSVFNKPELKKSLTEIDEIVSKLTTKKD
jgi:hypothetical protein